MKLSIATLILISSLLVAASSTQSISKQSATNEQNKVTQTESPELAEAEQSTAELLKLYKQNKYDEALLLAQRILMLRTKALGLDHMVVASDLVNLAEIYLVKGRKKEAKAHYERSIAIWEKNFGADNPVMVKILDRYICLLANIGESDEASDVRKRLYKLNNGIEFDKSVHRPISLALPKYLPEAKSKRISGAVVAKVTVDETGKVIAVEIFCGHSLLVKGAEEAIWKGRYRPVIVSGRPVKFTDVVTYNFVL